MNLSHAFHDASAGRLIAALPPAWAAILPLLLLSVLLVLLLVKAYRERQDILDVEDPDSPEDLLRSFEQARLAGDLDDEEFERVKQQLTRAGSGVFTPNPDAVRVAELLERRIADAEKDEGTDVQSPASELDSPSRPNP
jgi:hypothetical protein